MTIASPRTRGKRLPRGVRSVLARVRRRVRIAGVLRGLGLALGGAGAAFLLAMVADYLMPMSDAARWIACAVWVAMGVGIIVSCVLPALLGRPRKADLAAVAESAHPDVAERLTSAVELIETQRKARRAPDALIAALINEAESHSARIDAARAVPLDRAARCFGAGAAMVAAALSPLIFWSDPCQTLAARVAMPWTRIEPIGRYAVTVSPGDARAAIGDDVALVAEARPRLPGWLAGPAPDAAWIEWRDANGPLRRVPLRGEGTTEGACRFAGVLRAPAESILYRVATGAGRSREHTLTTIEPPAVGIVMGRVEPPEYTAKPPRDIANPIAIDAWEDSRVTLIIEANRAMEGVALRWPGRDEPVAMTTDANRTRWTADVEAAASGEYGFDLVDQNDLKSPKQRMGMIRVREDRPPILAVSGAESEVEARRDDLVIVDVAARDDVAVATAVIAYRVVRPSGEEDGPERTVAANLAGLGTGEASGQASFDLKETGAGAGDVVKYAVVVTDNRPAPRGPNVTRSDVRSVTIRADAEPLLARQSRAAREGMRAKIEAIRREATRGQQETSQLRYAADAALRGNGPWNEDSKRKLEERAKSTSKIVDDLKALARELAESGAYASLEQPAEDVANVEASAARDALEAASRAEDAERRMSELRQADARSGALVPRIDDLLRRLDEAARREEQLQRLRELAERQEALARRADHAARDEAPDSSLESIRQEQESLRREVEEIARRSPELKSEMLADQARRAEALARETEALAERQRQVERETASAENSHEARNERARLQEELVTEARRLALDVDVTLEENGRGRVDMAALKRPIEPLEQGQTESALQQIEQAEASLRRLARELDELPVDARARARRLARRQEQLQQQVEAARREISSKPENERADAARQSLETIAESQRALADAAKTLAAEAPADRRASAEEAARMVASAVEELEAGRAESAPGKLNEARGAFDRLAEAMPDANQRRQRAREALNDARGRLDGLIGDVERHARETQPPADGRGDPSTPARELARRLEPLATRAKETTEALSKVQADSETDAARDRAADRVETLRRAIEAARNAAPEENMSRREARNAGDWRLLGPFALGAAPMFDIGGPIDFDAVHIAADGKGATWRPAPGEVIDLRALFGEARSRNAAAFAVTEVTSPAAGRARLRLGSDDTLTVWVNGRQVFDFGGMRGFSAGQDTVAVDLREGANQIVVRCGNGEADWKFAVAVEPPIAKETAERLTRVERLRQAMPLLASDARASFDRVNQALDDRVPDDRRADEIADELAERLGNENAAPDPAAAPDLRRLASALRGLTLTEAAARKQEAARRIDRAADAMESGERPDRERAEALRETSELARSLMGEPSAARRAEALARIQSTLAEADRPASAPEQRQVAEELARIAVDPAVGSGDAARAFEAASESLDRARRESESPKAESESDQTALAREAADALAKLARALDAAKRADKVASPPPRPEPAAEDPTLNLPPNVGDAARALARRERELMDRMRAELAERAESQRGLRDDTSAVGRRMAQLREEVRETQLSGRAQGPAQSASDLLQQHAPRAMEQGIEQMSQGRIQGARDQQRQATDHLANAARQAQDLAAALRADMPQEASSHGEGEGEGQPQQGSLASARAEQRHAAGMLESRQSPGQQAPAPDAAGASGAMRRAAEGLRTAARSANRTTERLSQQLAESEGEMGDPSDARNPTPDSGPGQAVEPSQAMLDPAQLERDGRRWGDLPGHLRTEILQQSGRRYREEYARLIQLYFREIAGAGAPGAEAKP